MNIASWFEAHPAAVQAVRTWIAAHRHGESPGGSRSMVDELRRTYGYPFKDHTSFQQWAKRAFPDGYESVTQKRNCKPADPGMLKFRRTDADIRRIERKENFLFTCAIEGQVADTAFLEACLQWRKANDGILAVSPLNYENPRTRDEANEIEARDDSWWDPRLADFMLYNELRPHRRLSLMTTKTQATAANPLPARLSGRTQGRSAIFPHPQVAMRTVPTPQHKLPKILYSSGAITSKFYSDTVAGDMADFHHTLGGVIAEVRGDQFHLREVTWDGAGFIDCDKRYTPSGVEPAPPPDALVMGDVHAPHFVAQNVMRATFDPSGIVPTLSPRRLVLHDLADNRWCNPHEVNNTLLRAALAARGGLSMKRELQAVYDWLADLPGFEEIAVVYSNHDDFLYRWLDKGKPEPENEKLYNKLKFLMLDQCDEDTLAFPIALELALREMGQPRDDLRFLRPDESYVVNGVELGMHGHYGPNGARGSLRNLALIGIRSMFGHVHSPGIWQGAYAVGMSSNYRHGYNHGPSSWLQSHGLVHANGYRQLLHIINDDWRGR